MKGFIWTLRKLISPTEEDTVNGAEDSQQADMCVMESKNIQSKVLEKNDE